MTGKILVLDSVATNRIVMKVKLISAQYQVSTAATCADAMRLIAEQVPDLLLINLSDPIEDSHKFCTDLRADPSNKNLPIIAIGVADTSLARFAALDAGADDVLPRPLSDSMMLARIRGLLRRRNAALEWDMRDETSRALGFNEAAAPRLTPVNVHLLSKAQQLSSRFRSCLTSVTSGNVHSMHFKTALAAEKTEAKPDLIVIDATFASDEADICQLIADLQSRPNTRHAAILMIVPKDHSNMASRGFDLGAADVVFDNIDDEELILRTKRLLSQKLELDDQREKVRNGLHAAVTDPLTGLYNRRYAETHLSRISEQAEATGKSYALMVIDVDHFKSINDRFGHAAGDQILIKLSERLKSNCRAIDLIARIGGEEFLVGMPATSDAQARIAAERLRRIVGREPFSLGLDAPSIAVTISVGVAIDDLQDESRENSTSLFDRADHALYRAKSSGRDQVSVCSKAA